MFDNLIESKASKQKRAGGAFASAVIHAVLITAAVYGTLHASEALEKPKAEKVEFVTVKKDEPPPPKEQPKPPPDVVMKAPPPKGFQVLTAPIKIPDVLPQIDLNKAVTNAEDFTGKGVAGGMAKGVAGGTPAPAADANQTYFEFQVEKQVSQVPGNPAPRYPDMLRSANVEGEVLAQFVVDTTGRAEMSTFKVLKSTHDLFTNAVKASLPNMKFYAAEVGGKKVKQLVQMPFQFSLTKSE
ncbi:MAG TPA: TonB family protein [Gemmatimonadaceae bacterium]|jgi:protein TonB|nr:TonB family protein [Gemmatimonadaceae bacterium]